MKKILFILFLLITNCAIAQQAWIDVAEVTSDKFYDEGEALLKEDKYEAALEKFRMAISWAPQKTKNHSMAGATLYSMKKYTEANSYLREAFLVEPGNVNYVLNYLMSMVMEGRPLEEMKPLVGHAVQLFALPDMKEQGHAMFMEMLNESGVAVKKQLLDLYEQKMKTTPTIGAEVFSGVAEVTGYARDGRLHALADKLQRMEASMQKLANPYTLLRCDIYANVTLELMTHGFTEQAKQYAEKCLDEANKWPALLSNQATIAITAIVAHHVRKGDYTAAAAQLAAWKKKYEGMPVSAYQKFELLSFSPFIHAHLEQYKEAVSAARLLEEMAIAYKSPYYTIEVNHGYLKAYLKGPTREELKKALEYGEKALAEAKRVNYVGLMDAIRTNMEAARKTEDLLVNGIQRSELIWSDRVQEQSGL